MAFRTAPPRRESDVLTRQNYALTLDPIITQVYQALGAFGAAVQIGFDVREMAKAALKHVFYGTVHRGNSYWQVKAQLENLGVPSDIATDLYTQMYEWIQSQTRYWVPGGVNYTEYSFDFLNDTDIIIHQIPLHELPRVPIYD